MTKEQKAVIALMGLGIVRSAGLLQESHDGTHRVAEVAIEIGDLETAEVMADLCKHFNAINDALKAVSDRLMETLGPVPTTPSVSDLEDMFILLDPNNRGGH